MNRPEVLGGMIMLPIGVGYTLAGLDIARYGVGRIGRGGLGNIAIGGLETLLGLGATIGGIGLAGGSLYSIWNGALESSRGFVNSRPRVG